MFAGKGAAGAVKATYPFLVAVAFALLTCAPGLAATLPRPAPPLRLKTLSGEPKSLWALRGKVVLVLFFSSDCGHCKAAIEKLNPIYTDLKGRGFEVLGLAMNVTTSERLSQFAEDFHVQFPIGIGSRADWSRFGRFPIGDRPPYVPQLLFVGRQGKIRADITGDDLAFFDDFEGRFRAIVEPLLDETTSAKPAAAHAGLTIGGGERAGSAMATGWVEAALSSVPLPVNTPPQAGGTPFLCDTLETNPFLTWSLHETRTFF